MWTWYLVRLREVLFTYKGVFSHISVEEGDVKGMSYLSVKYCVWNILQMGWKIGSTLIKWKFKGVGAKTWQIWQHEFASLTNNMNIWNDIDFTQLGQFLAKYILNFVEFIGFSENPWNNSSELGPFHRFLCKEWMRAVFYRNSF